MTQACVTMLALVSLFFMSLRANRKFVHESRLPMQWSLSGAVNWTAPRFWALAFTPMLSAIILAGTTIASFTIAPRPGQADEVIPVITAMSLCFIMVHALHLWLIGRTVRARGN